MEVKRKYFQIYWELDAPKLGTYDINHGWASYVFGSILNALKDRGFERLEIAGKGVATELKVYCVGDIEVKVLPTCRLVSLQVSTPDPKLTEKVYNQVISQLEHLYKDED